MFLTRKAVLSAAFFSCLCLANSAAQAQTITASVNGTVTDSTGAILPNATILIKNVSTGVVTTATTNGDGQYSARFLQIGQYTITIQEKGFKSLTTAPFTLEVDQVAKIDGHLEIGESNQTVTVTDQLQPILDTDNSTLTTTFTANTIQNLPLNGRNFSSITMFLPGAVATEPTSMSNTNAIERDTNQGGQVSVNGNRNQTNNYLLDGIEINETINNVIGYNPSPDAIENLTVITSNAGAEYGNVNGGDVVAVLKSGTNHYHGSAFAFLENYNLDANTWANKAAGNPRQPFTQTIFGGTFGGPSRRTSSSSLWTIRHLVTTRAEPRRLRLFRRLSARATSLRCPFSSPTMSPVRDRLLTPTIRFRSPTLSRSTFSLILSSIRFRIRHRLSNPSLWTTTSAPIATLCATIRAT
ncbi:TonB-dependent receptor [Granulicella arctica]|uniref:TonB-dependent receptor plug domain-containing protein n=1 Tax=Granulicella arctica TaxID=940613 RepID=A0A7Y9PFF5_9BACT|nr:carboxypeptidase regulatory-like domain-containing protein [Granulicella arctica]NYF78183.1 hypothetical protein [Granulicella arctica]